MVISPYHGSRVLMRKRVSSVMCSSKLEGVEADSKEKMESEKANDLFDLAVVNSKSNSWRITIHFEYFPPRNYRDRIYFMGL